MNCIETGNGNLEVGPFDSVFEVDAGESLVESFVIHNNIPQIVLNSCDIEPYDMFFCNIAWVLPLVIWHYLCYKSMKPCVSSANNNILGSSYILTF